MTEQEKMQKEVEDKFPGATVVENTPAVKKNNEAAVSQPSITESDDVDTNDLIIPRAKLLQALSPECTDGDGKPGHIVNSLTKEQLPAEFIPIFFKKNWIRFNPRNSKDPAYNPAYEPGALIYSTDDPNSEMLTAIREDGRNDIVFGPNGERPRATVFLNFFSYFPGVDMPLIVSFCNTSLRAGKELLSLTQFLPSVKTPDGHKAMYGYTYSLSSTQKETDGNKYYVYTIKKGKKVEGDTLELCQDWYGQYAPKRRDISVHDETGWE